MSLYHRRAQARAEALAHLESLSSDPRLAPLRFLLVRHVAGYRLVAGGLSIEAEAVYAGLARHVHEADELRERLADRLCPSEDRVIAAEARVADWRQRYERIVQERYTTEVRIEDLTRELTEARALAWEVGERLARQAVLTENAERERAETDRLCPTDARVREFERLGSLVRIQRDLDEARALAWETGERLDARDARWQDVVARLEREKDNIYRERNALVCALSKVFPAWLHRHSETEWAWEEDWRWIVFIALPAGQVSWHIHDSEFPAFAHLPLGLEAWDGHTTAEKYRRLAALEAPSRDAAHAVRRRRDS